MYVAIVILLATLGGSLAQVMTNQSCVSQPCTLGTSFVDIALVIDTSTSIDRNYFQAIQNFIKLWASDYSIGPGSNQVQFGFVTYGLWAASYGTFSTASDTIDNLNSVVDDLAYQPYNERNIFDALTKVSNNLLSIDSNSGWRDNAKHLMVVFSGDSFTGSSTWRNVAVNLRMLFDRVVAIGLTQKAVTKQYLELVEFVGGDASNVFLIGGPTELNYIIPWLEFQVCDVQSSFTFFSFFINSNSTSWHNFNDNSHNHTVNFNCNYNATDSMSPGKSPYGRSHNGRHIEWRQSATEVAFLNNTLFYELSSNNASNLHLLIIPYSTIYDDGAQNFYDFADISKIGSQLRRIYDSKADVGPCPFDVGNCPIDIGASLSQLNNSDIVLQPSSTIVLLASATGADFATAITSAADWKRRGVTIITVAIGNNIKAADLGPLALQPSPTFALDGSAIGASDETLSHNIINALCAYKDFTFYPTSSPPTTIPITTSTTTTPPPCTYSLRTLADYETDFSNAHGARSDATDVVLLFAAGVDGNMASAIQTAKRLQQNGNIVVPIAIGPNVGANDLQQLAYNQTYSLYAPNVDHLGFILPTLTNLLYKSFIKLWASDYSIGPNLNQVQFGFVTYALWSSTYGTFSTASANIGILKSVVDDLAYQPFNDRNMFDALTKVSNNLVSTDSNSGWRSNAKHLMVVFSGDSFTGPDWRSVATNLRTKFDRVVAVGLTHKVVTNQYQELIELVGGDASNVWLIGDSSGLNDDSISWLESNAC
uniref:VWFA domain-containing protein n=1 Tax=Plectus sambesii TaxID=2011161 RepID=A0A914V8K3_9BILA